MFNQKSVLARLLANENITVQQGNFETASFNVATRTLNMPMWKDMGRDIYDMLVGHEVAHALYTPENFHEYMNEGIPHSWLNIVEDVRIEKLMLRKYPGLVANFKRGYFDLMMVKDLFGIKDVDFNKLGFMDRLNIACKARDLIEVPFTEEELPFVAQAKACETYDDVVQTCRDIQAWLGEKAEDAETDNHMSMSEEGEGEPQDGEQSFEERGETEGEDTGAEGESTTESEEGEEQENEDGSASASDEGEETEDEGETDASGSGEGEGEEENGESEAEEAEEETDGDNAETSAGQPIPGDANGEAITDSNWQNNQSDLVEDTKEVGYCKGLTRDQLNKCLITHETLAEARVMRLATLTKSYSEMGYRPSIFPESEYTQFLAETKRVVNLMVKEFEMRKAAYRSARARTSTRGSLDVNKLHSYKYDDHLFKQVAKLADAKNHGLMMIVDYSGSMHPMMPAVIRQLLALVMFCKRVGIPYEVYSFTSGDGSGSYDREVTTFENDRLRMCELFSTRMTKRQYEEAFKMMFWQTKSSYNTWGWSDYEDMGNTPLNSALQACSYLIDDFRKKYPVDKMNLVTLTDGDSNHCYILPGADIADRWIRPNAWRVEYNRQTVEIAGRGGWSNGRSNTAAFVKALNEKGVNTVNYYIAGRKYDLNAELKRSLNWDHEKINAARKEIRNNGVFVSDDVYGYNRRFVMLGEGAELNGEVDELEVNGDMTAAKIAKAFSKNSGSKKKSRIVTQKFAEIVA